MSELVVRLSVPTMLSNDLCLETLRKFALQERCRAGLDFWLAVEDFRKLESSPEIHKSASRIWDQFLRPYAAQSVLVYVEDRVPGIRAAMVSNRVDRALFNEAQERVLKLCIVKEVAPLFVKSQDYADMIAVLLRQLAVTGRTNASGLLVIPFRYILINPVGLYLFREYLAALRSEHLLDFYVSVDSYRTRVLSAAERVKHAAFILRRYLHEDSENCVLQDSELMARVEMALAKNASPTIFEEAKAQVFHRLDKCYVSYLKSDDYVRMVAQMQHNAYNDSTGTPPMLMSMLQDNSPRFARPSHGVVGGGARPGAHGHHEKPAHDEHRDSLPMEELYYDYGGQGKRAPLKPKLQPRMVQHEPSSSMPPPSYSTFERGGVHGEDAEDRDGSPNMFGGGGGQPYTGYTGDSPDRSLAEEEDPKQLYGASSDDVGSVISDANTVFRPMRTLEAKYDAEPEVAEYEREFQQYQRQARQHETSGGGGRGPPPVPSARLPSRWLPQQTTTGRASPPRVPLHLLPQPVGGQPFSYRQPPPHPAAVGAVYSAPPPPPASPTNLTVGSASVPPPPPPLADAPDEDEMFQPTNTYDTGATSTTTTGRAAPSAFAKQAAARKSVNFQQEGALANVAEVANAAIPAGTAYRYSRMMAPGPLLPEREGQPATETYTDTDHPAVNWTDDELNALFKPVKALDKRKAQEQDVMSLLKKGERFLKFGRHGKPHLKLVKLIGDDTVAWFDIKKNGQVDHSHKTLPVKDVTQVVRGRTTDVFQRERNLGSSIEKRCLSLVAKDRTLDLQAESLELCEKWFNAFKALLDKKNLGYMQFTQSGRSYSGSQLVPAPPPARNVPRVRSNSFSSVRDRSAPHTQYTHVPKGKGNFTADKERRASQHVRVRPSIG